MIQARKEDVKQLYERFPFPYGIEESRPDMNFANLVQLLFPDDDLEDQLVLDAGCGTGHKLIALARIFPETRFVGMDFCEASLRVARRLAQENKVQNVELRRADLGATSLAPEFDLILSIGVVHSMENPQKALDILCSGLADDGILLLWLYHSLGEFDRLNQRELVRLLWGEDRNDMAKGLALMQDLGLGLKPGHYGSKDWVSGVLEGNTDAFLNPIVYAYRLLEALDMCAHAGCTWGTVDMLNLPGKGKFVNLAGIDDPLVGDMSLGVADLFEAQSLREAYGRLSKRERLRAIELVLKPTGFFILAGKGQAQYRLSERLRGNLIELASDRNPSGVS